MPEQQSFPGLAPQDPPAWTSRGVEPGSAMARSDGESIYRRVSTRMHIDEKVRRLTRPEPCGWSLWEALISGEQVDIIPGLFRIGEAAFAEQLRWPLKGFRDAWNEVQRAELRVKADWDARLVWVVNALKHNMPASPNVIRSWKDCWRDRLPECALKEEAREFIENTLKAFSEPYAKAFVEVCGKASLKPFDKAIDNGSPKGLSESGAVSSKQLAVSSEDVDSSKGGVRGGISTACESVNRSDLEGLSPSDRAEIQELLKAEQYARATTRLAELRKRVQP